MHQRADKAEDLSIGAFEHQRGNGGVRQWLAEENLLEGHAQLVVVSNIGLCQIGAIQRDDLR